jgi:hypothetical protein
MISNQTSSHSTPTCASVKIVIFFGPRRRWVFLSTLSFGIGELHKDLT